MQDQAILARCGNPVPWLGAMVLVAVVSLFPARGRTAGDQAAPAAAAASPTETEAATEKSVRPGINDNFKKADLKVAEWVERFEGESREVFTARQEILKAVGVQPGQRVADIGAGTGLYTRLFAELAGTEGQVFAVDIAQPFIDHITSRAKKEGLKNITGVVCSDRSVNLSPDSVDVAFICDTYHHFEFPHSTMRSLQKALKPGGKLVVIDFKRIPGESRAWTLEHVRAGQETFQKEIEAAGFRFVDEAKVPGLQENYCLRFEKK